MCVPSINEFGEYAAQTPNVHFVAVITIEEDFGGSVPERDNLCV